MKTPNDYRSEHAVAYETPDRRGYTRIHVFPELIGRTGDQDVLNVLHALRPSSIRVTSGWTTDDARTWRVTVVVNESDVIKSISQEVEVGLVGRRNGADVRIFLKATPKRISG